MGKIGKKGTLLLAAAGLASLLTFNSALAGPPPSRQVQSPARPLDLRAPAHPIETSYRVAAFSSMAHQQPGVAPQQDRLASLGGESMHAQPTVQQRVQLFRRDGLPLARLWENGSTLVHLGLNPKGKPGLWLVQKTR